jgi:acylphosphatase
MSAPYRRAHLIISGLVQGVGYRYYTMACARRRALSGWVRNLDSGQVEAVVEGEEGLICDLIKELRIGPRMAAVNDVTVEWEEYVGQFQDFIIED